MQMMPSSKYKKDLEIVETLSYMCLKNIQYQILNIRKHEDLINEIINHNNVFPSNKQPYFEIMNENKQDHFMVEPNNHGQKQSNKK